MKLLIEHDGNADKYGLINKFYSRSVVRSYRPIQMIKHCDVGVIFTNTIHQGSSQETHLMIRASHAVDPPVRQIADRHAINT